MHHAPTNVVHFVDPISLLVLPPLSESENLRKERPVMTYDCPVVYKVEVGFVASPLPLVLFPSLRHLHPDRLWNSIVPPPLSLVFLPELLENGPLKFCFDLVYQLPRL